MSRKGLIGIVLVLLAVIVAVVVVVLTLTSGKPANQEAQTFEKGALSTQVPSPVTPLPTGPTQPTAAPTRPAVVAAATAIPTATPTLLPATATGVTAPATVLPPTPTSAPKPANFIIPAKISIPAIKVDTFVERVGVTNDGNMDVPKNIWNTGWFGNGGYRPGDLGNAVIAGHLDAPGTVAVFWNLDKLKAGDKVVLTDQAGKTMTFVVYDAKVYSINDAPLQTIFGPSNEAHLNLITCGGTYDRASQNYNKRLVVYTRLDTTA